VLLVNTVHDLKFRVALAVRFHFFIHMRTTVRNMAGKDIALWGPLFKLFQLELIKLDLGVFKKALKLAHSAIPRSVRVWTYPIHVLSSLILIPFKDIVHIPLI
jgi:hypothetical protein